MKKRGKGVCTTHYPTGLTFGGDPSQAIVRMNADGTVQLLIGTVDHGQGAKTVFAQMVAYELGIPVENVYVVNADTATAPICTGSFASRATHMTGNAVKRACDETKQVLFEVAAEELGVEPDALEMKEGQIVVKEFPEQAVPIADIATKATWVLGKLVAGRGAYIANATALDLETGEGKPYDTYEYATNVAEVEVDTETGQVDVLHMYMAYDVGKAINPMMVEGQLQSGALMGMSWTLLENLYPFYPDVEYVPTSYKDYPIPTAVDIPELDTAIVEVPSVSGFYGQKGVGEFTMNSQAAAIAAAVHDAIGVWIPDLPITPEKVLKALKEKEAAE